MNTSEDYSNDRSVGSSKFLDSYSSEDSETDQGQRMNSYQVPNNSTFLRSSESDEETILDFFNATFIERNCGLDQSLRHHRYFQELDQDAPLPQDINISFLSTTSVSDLYSAWSTSSGTDYFSISVSDTSSIRNFFRIDVPPTEANSGNGRFQIFEVPQEQQRRTRDLRQELGEPLSESQVLEILDSSRSILHYSDIWVSSSSTSLSSLSSSVSTEGNLTTTLEGSYCLNFRELVSFFENHCPSEQRLKKEVPVNQKCVADLVRAFEEKNR